MTTHAVLTAIGADRPGLVEEVSEFVFKHGGNIEDSRMANLRGQFTMMLLVNAPGDALRKMQIRVAGIQHSGLHIEIRAASPTTAPRAASGRALSAHRIGAGPGRPGPSHRPSVAFTGRQH